MSDLTLLLLGAAIAVIGGAIGDEFHAWGDRRRERKAIKIAVGDELSEIETTTAGMHTVWESAHVITPNLVADLVSNTTVYDGLRTRLFLIKDEELRRELSAFYKKVKDTARKTDGKIGSLAVTPDATAEQAAFDTMFQALGIEARQLKGKIGV